MSNPNPHTYDHVVAFVVASPWAIEREMLPVIANIVGRRLAGDDTAPDVRALANRRELVTPAAGGVAVLPMYGVLMPRANMFTEISGGTSYEQAARDVRDAVANKDVGTIVLDWDSPGGNVQGATEFAREVLKARTVKPVISQVNFRMCSAAYWVGACATEIVASPSAVVGAIGVYTMHDDLSAALAAKGIKRSYLSKGKYKVDGNETAPLSDDTRERWLAELDKPYAAFLKDVAAGRGVTVDAVRAGYGEGRAVQADDALALGMVDRIGTLDDTLARLLTPATGASLVHADTSRAADTSQSALERAAVVAADRAWRTDVERQLLRIALH